MTKAEIRKKYKALRLALNETQVEDISIKIANKLLQLPVWDKNYYHLFLPIKKQKEVDTCFILAVLQGKEKAVTVSRSNFTTGILTHYLLTDKTVLKENRYGIPEPVDAVPVAVSKIDVVFAPLLAFDKKGYRVGYGKGFYDRFLAECRAETLKIGLSFFEPEEKIDDISAADIRLDYCVTPESVYDFS